MGFPHSEIPGSSPACGSPRLIAACHVLHRLLLPRHPPCALSNLTIKFTGRTHCRSSESFPGNIYGRLSKSTCSSITGRSPSHQQLLSSIKECSPCLYI